MTIDDLLNESRDVPSASEETIASTRRAVLADVEASVVRMRRVAMRRAKGRRLAGALIATAACGTALLVVARDGDVPASTVATSPGSPPPTGTAPSPSPRVVRTSFENASQVLIAAAAAPGPQDIAQDSTSFWRVDSVDHAADGTSVSRTVWSSRDAGVYVQDSRDRVDGVRLGGPTTFPTLGRVLSWDDLFDLPTDATSMLRTLRGSSARADADHVAFKTIFDLLSTSPAPRDVRVALWRAAADLDGVSLVGRLTDAQGRRGWGVTDGSSTYIVSPETGRLLESRYEGPDGAVSTTTIVREGPTSIAPKVAPRGRKSGG